MDSPQVAMISLWRNDVARRLIARANHLIGKTYPNLRWIWVVGDSDDETYDLLKLLAGQQKKRGKKITVISHTTPWKNGTTGKERLLCLSASCVVGFDQITPSDTYVLNHESDLLSPSDVIEQLLASGHVPVAPTTWLPLPDGRRLFYDIWAFEANGVRFTNLPPYHAVYKPDEPFIVDSFGSVWLLHAEDILAGLRPYTEAAREVSRKLRELGRELWCEPRVQVEQPYELWVPHNVADH